MSHRITKILTDKNINIKVLRYYNQGVSYLDLSILNQVELDKYNGYKSEKRKLEFYYSRVLWQTFNQNEIIKYKSTGKPILNRGFISISHSHHKVAIAYSETKEMGLDLEFRSKKVQIIKHKFLHENENYSSIKDLTIIWTIKEAIYKLYDNDKLFFKDHIYTELNKNSANVSVNLVEEKTHPTIQFFTIGQDYILSFAL